MKKIFSLTLLVTLLLSVTFGLKAQNENLFYRAAGTPENPKVQATWNKYYTVAGVTDL